MALIGFKTLFDDEDALDLFQELSPFAVPRSGRALAKLEKNFPQLASPKIVHNHYNVNLDLHQFDPSEISVKVEDRSVKVSAKREIKSKNGEHYELRQYEQHFTVPDNVHIEELKSQLDQRGILRMQAPIKPQLEDKARHIPIEFVKK